MVTPLQLTKIAFTKAHLQGCSMTAADEIITPLMPEYSIIYHENRLMADLLHDLERALEPYQNGVSAPADTTTVLQKAEKALRYTEETSTRMLHFANQMLRKAAGIPYSELEQVFVAAFRQVSGETKKIQVQMAACIKKLERLHTGVAPAAKPLTGIPSVDKPWMKFYPPDAAQMTVPNKSLNAYMREMSRGDALTVMHYYGTDISWKEFFRAVDDTARAMRALGLGEGDQIPVLLRATPEFLIILLAAERIGASLLCRDNTIPENAEAIHKAGAHILFVHDFITREEIRAYAEAGIQKFVTIDPWRLIVESETPDYILNNLRTCYTEPEVEDARVCDWETFLRAGRKYTGVVDAPADPDRPLFRAYTSGSTGPSKQVIHSAKTMLAVVHQLSAYGSSDDFRPTWMMTILPPALIAVTVSMLLMPMASNKLLILNPFVDVNDIDLEMMRYRPNGWPMIPMFVEILMRSKRIPADYDMSHLIAAGAGAEAFNNGQVQRAQKFLNDHNCQAIFTVGYGQSEAGSNITFPCPAFPIANGNVGIPMPLNTMGIFRGDRECGYNEKGEICVTGPGNMLGYDNEEATNRTLIRHADGKLWLHTGDTGYMNEDGVVYALGRGLAKRYNPQNPEKSRRLVEIAMENQISDAAIPGLVDSFFVIANDPEHAGYQVPYLYVVLEKGRTVESIEADVLGALKEYQHPVEIIQIPERPFYHFKTNRLHMEAPYRRN